jgi:hypothetical protein
MPIPFEPWIAYPSLTLDRLTTVAALMRDTRNSTVLLHDESAGDSSWSLGCRIYSRTIANISREAASTPWLDVLPETHTLRFTFAIGSVPMKFYKGEPEDVPGRSQVRSYAELRQLSLAFEMEGIAPTHVLRLAVESDSFHNTSAITLVEVDEAGEPTRIFDIPLSVANVLVMQTKPIDVAPPKLEVIATPVEDTARAESEDKLGASGTES